MPAGAVTAAAVLVVVAYLGVLGWERLGPAVPFEAGPDVEFALLQIVERTLDAQTALANAPAWERWLYRWIGLDGGEGDLDAALVWLEELTDVAPTPDAELALAVLRGEMGRRDALRASLADWERRDEPFPALARVVDAAYRDAPPPPAEARALLAESGADVPEGWAADRLALRLAARAGDSALTATLADELAQRAAPLRGRVRALALGFVVALGGGAVALGVLLARGRTLTLVASAPLPPPWSGRAGATVLVQGAALGIILLFALVGLPDWMDVAVVDDAWLPLVVTVAGPLPVLVLARRRLLAPAGLGYRQSLGLAPGPGRARPLVLTALALVAIGYAGDLVLGHLAELAGGPAHWTEWFDSQLVWGDPVEVAGSLVALVVATPILEEVAFRGLLYGTLRRAWGPAPSALASAVVFALAHSYGPWGLASVTWSGVLWALAYERTRSLWPGILAHAAGNLASSLALLGLLR